MRTSLVWGFSAFTLVAQGGAARAEKRQDLRSTELYARTIDGADTKLAPYAGKRVTLLNLWATWCGPCREEMPALNALHKKYEARGGKVVGLDVDESAATVKKFLGTTRIDYPVLLSTPNKTLPTLGDLEALPTTIVLDEKGEVLEVLVGGIEVPYLEKLMDARLAGKPAARK